MSTSFCGGQTTFHSNATAAVVTYETDILPFMLKMLQLNNAGFCCSVMRGTRHPCNPHVSSLSLQEVAIALSTMTTSFIMVQQSRT